MDMVLNNNISSTSISRGGKAEGLGFAGSDYDEMSVFEILRVYENLHSKQFEQNKVLLLMESNDTKPGFTKLKLYNELHKNTP